MNIINEVRDIVEEAIREGSTKDQLIESVFSTLDLEDTITGALRERIDELEDEQGALREEICELKEAIGLDIDVFETDDVEINEKETEWDLLEEQIQDAHAMLLKF